MKPEIDKLYETAVTALTLFERANKQSKPGSGMDMAKLLQLSDLAALARARCGDAIKALTNDEVAAAIAELDVARRVDVARAGLIGAKPMVLTQQ